MHTYDVDNYHSCPYCRPVLEKERNYYPLRLTSRKGRSLWHCDAIVVTERCMRDEWITRCHQGEAGTTITQKRGKNGQKESKVGSLRFSLDGGCCDVRYGVRSETSCKSELSKTKAKLERREDQAFTPYDGSPRERSLSPYQENYLRREKRRKETGKLTIET